MVRGTDTAVVLTARSTSPHQLVLGLEQLWPGYIVDTLPPGEVQTGSSMGHVMQTKPLWTTLQWLRCCVKNRGVPSPHHSLPISVSLETKHCEIDGQIKSSSVPPFSEDLWLIRDFVAKQCEWTRLLSG